MISDTIPTGSLQGMNASPRPATRDSRLVSTNRSGAEQLAEFGVEGGAQFDPELVG
jgi:hypothetical protein